MEFVQANVLLILLMIASGVMLLWPLVQKRAAGIDDVGTLKAIQLINKENAVLLDVRDAKQYTGQKIANALHCTASDFEAHLGKLLPKKDKPVILYDERGLRARSAATELKKAGYTTIYHLQGGLNAWRDAGLPLEKIA
jgi:rhodanese-related sulfurtransferase